jgi:hypothetical protein
MRTSWYTPTTNLERQAADPDAFVLWLEKLVKASITTTCLPSFFYLNHGFFVEESSIIKIRHADLKCKHKLKSLCTSKFSSIYVL